MPTTITVYSKSKCVQCVRTKRWLDDRDIEYQTVNLDQSPADLEAVRALGYLTAPVVVVSNGDPETDIHWGGFIPDHLNKYTLPSKAA